MSKPEAALALDFLRRCDTKDEIVSTGRLTALQIANARAAGTMYVEPGGGRGWVVRPSGPAPTWVGQQEAQERISMLRAKVKDLEAKLAEAQEHERQTHERLGAILGTDDSLEQCAKRMKAEVERLRIFRDLVEAVMLNRGVCFVPDDKDGLRGWDERARAALRGER